MANTSLHRTAIPLRSIATGELRRWALLKAFYLRCGSRWKIRHFLDFLLKRGGFIGVEIEVNAWHSVCCWVGVLFICAQPVFQADAYGTA